MNVKLTNETLAALALPAGKTDHIEFDGDLPGFGVRLRRGRDGSVKRSWLVQYRLGVQQRRESLGDVRKVKLEDARKIARQRFAQVELGTDPAAERAKARADAAASKLTLGVVADLYLAAKKDRQRPSTHGQCKLHLTGHWKALRDHPIDTIKRADVAAALQGITKAHGRTAASRARSNLSALFMWAMGEGLREDNPVIATNNPAEGILSRERVLSDAELQIVWNACRDDDFGRIVKLLLLTGCRREELGGLKRSEVNLDTGIMTVPGTRTKNYREHALTLPAVAIDILKSVPARPDREFFSAFVADRSARGAMRPCTCTPGLPKPKASRSRDGRCMTCVEPCAPAWAGWALLRTLLNWCSITGKAGSRRSMIGTNTSARSRWRLRRGPTTYSPRPKGGRPRSCRCCAP